MYETILSPVDYGGLRLKNRILFAPTTFGLSDEETLAKYRALAEGGCAMIIVGDVPVGKSRFEKSLFDAKGFAFYQQLAEIAHAADCKLCAQLHQSDSDLLAMLTPEHLDSTFWIFVIFAYYILATMFPIDKIIGKIYPLFAIALIFMAIGILVMLFVSFPAIPEITDGLENKIGDTANNPIFPMLFISIACGAISGFHATQSPLMARCMTNERQGRYIFYGAMVTEGIVALIWAAAATYFFSPEGQSFFGVTEPAKVNGNSAIIVNTISKGWLGIVGGALAILGVVAAPITSGDTAFRSARLIVADFLHMEQRSIIKRLMICVPLFVIAIVILIYNLADPAGFEKIWRYFAWSNQTLAVFTLWAITVYLAQQKKPYWITLIPALFMMAVVLTYILFDRSGIALSYTTSVVISIVAVAVSAIYFFIRRPHMNDHEKL